jgi:branched-chain amino acid transport system substrate-binding protein
MKSTKLLLKFGRFCISLIMVLTAIALLASCGKATTTSVTSSDAPVVTHWTFPMLGTFTGPGAWAGVDVKWALEQAVNDINAAGGIRGLPVVIAYYDTAGPDPAKAVQLFTKAASGNLAILGPIFSSENVACGATAKQIGIPYLTSGSDDWAAIYPCAPWLFTPYADCYDSTALQLVNYFNAIGGVKTLCLICMTSEEYTKEVHDKTLTVCEANGVKVNVVDVPTSTVDFAPAAAKAISTKSDAYMLDMYSPACASTIHELRKLGVTDSKTIVTNCYAFSDSFFQQGGQDLDGTYVIDTYDPGYAGGPDGGAAWRKFLEEYRTQVNAYYPNNTTRFMYDFPWMLKNAIEQLKITGDPAKITQERKAIRDWLYSLKDWQGLACTYTCYPTTGGCPQHCYMFIMNGNKPQIIPGTELQAPIPTWVLNGGTPPTTTP